jgi:deoxyribodipyrimidine photo-lyase
MRAGAGWGFGEKHFMAANWLVWFRNDLRLADNPALSAALETGGKVTAVHIEETDASVRPRGAASRWWLHHSLNALGRDLARLGVPLETLSGPADAGIRAAVDAHGADAVFWNRRYGRAERDVDTAIKVQLKSDGIGAESFAGNVLIEPFDIETKTGGPYGVFTPFWVALRHGDIPAPLSPPHRRETIMPRSVDMTYETPAWARKFEQHWKIGEAAAQGRLEDFLDTQIVNYREGRDRPAHNATSRLSPHLAFGEISARQIWHTAIARAHHEPELAEPVEAFLRELAWRDFNAHQLYHRPDIATVPMQPRFASLAWRNAPADLTAWQRGETGIPIVDAGMRELWETGFMHNRVRMIAASFLTKNLLIHWREGERWFWDTLMDADPANNPGNWQWVAGTGLDAAPYFRIFNPLTQAEKFDPEGAYVQRWSPTPRDPIVNLKTSRERALEAFKAL